MSNEEIPIPEPQNAAAAPPAKRSSLLARIAYVFLFLATLVALFYAEENWRGRRAWEATKAEAIAKGEHLEWSYYLVTPPHDYENVMKYGGMETWYIKGRDESNSSPSIHKSVIVSAPKPPVPQIASGVKTTMTSTQEVTQPAPQPPDIQLGEIRIVGNSADSELVTGKAEVLENADKLSWNEKRNFLDRVMAVKMAATPDGFTICLPPKGPPVTVIWRSTAKTTADELEKGLNIRGTNKLETRPHLNFEPDRNQSTFKVSMFPQNWYTPEEFLDRSPDHPARAAIVHEAAKRPVTYLSGDYKVPFAVPIQNYVAVRTFAQRAGGRAQAYMLLGNSDKAFEELNAIRDIRRVLDSKPKTLVTAMIDVAVMGLYVSVIEEGFANELWTPAQLQDFATYLETVDIFAKAVESMRAGERAGVIQLIESTPPSELPKVFGSDGKSPWRDPVFLTLRLGPRGWLYQNLSYYTRKIDSLIDAIDDKTTQVDPLKLGGLNSSFFDDLERHNPFSFLAGLALPNFTKAFQRTAQNTSWVRQTIIAVALEKYRSETGNYPPELSALVPKYLSKVPSEVVCRQPVKYRLLKHGGYLLYSVGWDLKDDSASEIKEPIEELKPDRYGRVSLIQGGGDSKDWVWKGVPYSAMRR